MKRPKAKSQPPNKEERKSKKTKKGEKNPRRPFSAYRAGGLITSFNAKHVKTILEELKRATSLDDVEQARPFVEAAAGVFRRNKRIDEREPLYNLSMKERALSQYVGAIIQTIDKNDDHSSEVMRLIRRSDIKVAVMIKPVLDALRRACDQIDSLSPFDNSNLPDVGTDQGVALLIKAWESLPKSYAASRRSNAARNMAQKPSSRTLNPFAYNYSNIPDPKDTSKKRMIFTAPSMYFLQCAVRVLDRTIKSSRIRTAAERHSKMRLVNDIVVETIEKSKS